MGILDLIRRPKPVRKTDLKQLFVPVIFANGKDDDLPGIVAAIENRAVQFDEKIYRPDEDLTIFKREIALSCMGLAILDRKGENRLTIGCTPADITVQAGCHAPDGRRLTFNRCRFLLNFRGRM